MTFRSKRKAFRLRSSIELKAVGGPVCLSAFRRLIVAWQRGESRHVKKFDNNFPQAPNCDKIFFLFALTSPFLPCCYSSLTKGGDMEFIFQAIATIASCISAVYAVRNFHQTHKKPKGKHRK